MKKILTFMSTLLLSCTLLAGCSKNLNPTNYLINSDGNLIVVYDDGTTEDLGEWGDEIIDSLADVTVSEDGYYIINGIKTNIKAVEPVSYELENKWEAWIKAGVLCSEMETASLFTVASVLKMKAAAVLLVVWNQEKEKKGMAQETSFDVDKQIFVAIRAISNIIKGR